MKPPDHAELRLPPNNSEYLIEELADLERLALADALGERKVGLAVSPAAPTEKRPSLLTST